MDFPTDSQYVRKNSKSLGKPVCWQVYLKGVRTIVYQKTNFYGNHGYRTHPAGHWKPVPLPLAFLHSAKPLSQNYGTDSARRSYGMGCALPVRGFCKNRQPVDRSRQIPTLSISSALASDLRQCLDSGCRPEYLRRRLAVHR